jgi:hypothetical protein
MNSTDIIKFSLDILQADPRFSDIDMSESSAFYNMVILPFSVLAKPLFDINATTLRSMQLENMSSSQLDEFAKLFFITRRTQSLTNISIQIYLNNVAGVVEPLVVSTTDEFRTSQNAVFYPIQNYLFTYELLPTVVLAGITYRVATIICSSSLSLTPVAPNSIKTTSISHPQLNSVNNLQSSSVPLSAETDAEFIQSIKKSLTNRNAVGPDSIYTILKTAYPNITDCLSIGYGDPEMQRDIAVAAKSWSGHFGGMTDIYIRTESIPTTFTTTATRNADSTGYTFTLRRYKGFDWNAVDTALPGAQSLLPWTKLQSANPLPIMPVISFDWMNSTITNTTFKTKVNGEVDYIVEVLPDPVEKAYGKNYRYSIYESLRITVLTTSAINATEVITLNYNTLNSFEDIQTFIGSDARVITSVNLIKSFIPIQVKQLVIVYDQNYYVNEQLWATNIANMINGWSLQEPIRLSTLLKDFDAPVRISELWADPVVVPTNTLSSNLPYLFDSTGEITGVQTSTSYPCFAKMVVDNIDGSSNCYLSTRQIYPKIKNGLSATYRTCRYFINPTDITFIKGSW